MSRLGTVRFRGKSGNKYRFEVYPLQAVLEEGIGGIYVATERKRSKSKPGFVHVRKSTGQSDDLRMSLSHGEKSFATQGANCFCVYVQSDETVRQEIEQDLMRKPRPSSNA